MQHYILAPCVWNNDVLSSKSNDNFEELYLVRVWTQAPLSTSHSITVESKLADASTRFMFGLFVPGPVGLHLIVYISFWWALRSWTQFSLSIVHTLMIKLTVVSFKHFTICRTQTFSVMSSLQDARNFPWGSHLMALTSFVWPWNDLMGLSLPSWHTWICLSVEHEAKLSSDFQSTSRAGAEWKPNCCLQLPVAASQMIVVLQETLKFVC